MKCPRCEYESEFESVRCPRCETVFASAQLEELSHLEYLKGWLESRRAEGSVSPEAAEAILGIAVRKAEELKAALGVGATSAAPADTHTRLAGQRPAPSPAAPQPTGRQGTTEGPAALRERWLAMMESSEQKTRPPFQQASSSHLSVLACFLLIGLRIAANRVKCKDNVER